MKLRMLAGNGRIRVCFPFVGDDLGGSHVSAAKLINGLDLSRIDPVIVLQDVAGPVAPFLKRQGLGYLYLPVPKILSPGERPGVAAATYFARTLPLIRRFLREGRFDIVHTNDGRTHVNWGVAARFTGAKLVWHHRGDPNARGARYLAPLIAHRMVTVSNFSRPSRPIVPLTGRLSVVHSPFDHPPALPDRVAAKSALLSELGLPAGTRVLGYFGGLIDRKRPLLFVDVVHRLRQRHPEIPIIGCLFGLPSPGCPDFGRLARERAAELGIGDAVRVMGYRSPIEPCIAATDILLVPAVCEPFGRTLIEAMLLGTPVVATKHGGNPEAISDGHTGYLVAPEDADAFVRPVAELLGDPATFSRIAKEARRDALSKYGTVAHVEQITKLYTQILGRKAALGTTARLTESMQ